jgi:hypothetical protein
MAWRRVAISLFAWRICGRDSASRKAATLDFLCREEDEIHG